MPVPGEARLAVELSVSKGTAHRALNALLADGTLLSVLGKGPSSARPTTWGPQKDSL
ncbi:hypothetical protein [Nonomuraea coxensis]